MASTTASAAGVAHTLNREIGRIRKRVQWIRNELNGLGTPQLYRYTQEIETSAVDLLKVAEHSHSELEEGKERTDLTQFVPECIKSFLAERGETSITMHAETCFTPLWANVDRPILQRVLHDLSRNAIEAMRGRLVQKIIVHVHPSLPNHVELKIEDTGPGILDLSVRQKLLNEPFSHKGRDRGRGLILARYAIQRMDGKIRLLPYELERGAVFSIRFPTIGSSE